MASRNLIKRIESKDLTTLIQNIDMMNLIKRIERTVDVTFAYLCAIGIS